MTEKPTNRPAADDDALAKLIRLAGSRPVAPEEARSRVYSSVHASWQQAVTAHSGRRGNVRWLAAAAALACIAAGIAMLRPPAPGPGAALASLRVARGDVSIARAGANESHPAAELAGAPLRAGDTLRTATGGRAALELANGAVSLRLHEHTHVVLRAADRVELARGTIYVDAGPTDRPATPLTLVTSFGDVYHVGTQFELHADEEALRIRVREGAVQFEGAHRALQSAAGDELLIPAQGEPVRGHIGADDPAWDWAAALASFHGGNYSAAAMLAWIGREMGRPVRFDSPATQAHAETLQLHGAEGLSPAESLEVVAATTDLRYELEPTAIIIHAGER